MARNRVSFAVGLILVAALVRVVPHPPNFVPTVAMALLAGSYLERRLLAIAVTFAAMLLSDLALGLHASMAFVYGALALIVLLGGLLKRDCGVKHLGAAVFSSSVLFFVVTNFGVWLVTGLYPLSLAGLLACFAAAIPFFGSSVVGDAFFAFLLFGAMRVVERRGVVRTSAA